MRSGNDVNGFRMAFTTVFRTARLLLFQGQVLSCMTEALRRRQRQSLAFENRQPACAGLRLARAVRAARLSLVVAFFETDRSLLEIIF